MNSVRRPEVPDPAKQLRQALVAVEPEDRRVLAYYGGPNGLGLRDYAQSQRQAGSSFKPYVLATALADAGPGDPGRQEDQRLQDLRRLLAADFAGTTRWPTPRAASATPCSLMEAITESLNTVFYRLGIDAGPANVPRPRTRWAIPAERDRNGQTTLPGEERQHRAGISHRPVRDAHDRPGRRASASSPPAARCTRRTSWPR